MSRFVRLPLGINSLALILVLGLSVVGVQPV
jgi:hypothetical protein